MTFEQLKEQVRTISETLKKEEFKKLFEQVKNLNDQLEKEKDTISLEGICTEDLIKMISELINMKDLFEELLKNAREDFKAC